jgi:hypothetical protein
MIAVCYVSSLQLFMLILTKFWLQAMNIKGVFFALLGAAVVQVHCAFSKSSHSIFMFVE